MPGACCYYGVCCPPEAQATALAEHEKIDVTAAVMITANYRLVPKSIEPGPDHLSEEHVRSAKQRLEKLHRRIHTELKGILLDMGHGTEG